MSRFPLLAAVSILLGALLAVPAQAAISRTYVASYGDDANTAYSCDFAHPCRTFQTAYSQVTTGGEVLALDGSGYGTLTIDRSVSIIGNPGVFAGIGVFSGNGITIATAGVKVILRGLTINGQGGSNGVRMSAGSSLLVENCSFNGFSTSSTAAIYVSGSVTARIVNSTIANSWSGVTLENGPTATISGMKMLSMSEVGVWVHSTTAGATTTAFIDNTVVAAGTVAFNARADDATTISRMHITNSVASGASFGVYVSGVGTEEVSVSGSLLSTNTYGVYSNPSAPASRKVILSGNTITFNSTGLYNGSGTMVVLGNNAVHSNGIASSGTITSAATM